MFRYAFTNGYEFDAITAAECTVSDGEPCIACVEFQELDAKIRATNHLSEQLAERCHVLKSEMNHYHDRLIKHLPLEIISHIFTFCFRMESSEPEYPYDKHVRRVRVRVPLTLGAVCRSWKAIAWSTLQLWTSITIDLDDCCRPSHNQLTREWLGRSGQLPLSISIFRSFRNNEVPDTMFYPVIDALNEHSSRWKSLDVHLSKHLLSRMHGNSSGESILQSLRIIPHYFWSFGAEAIFRMENMTPSPTKITTQDMAFRSIEIQWNHVTHVEMRDLSMDECLELIQHAHQLRHCDFRSVSEYDDERPHPANSILHHSIQSLEFGSCSDVIPDRFYNCLSLPALQKLTYWHPILEDADPADTYTTLDSLVARSSCRLTHLSIRGASVPDHDQALMSLLGRSPFITELSILGDYDHAIPDLLFRHLSSPTDPTDGETAVFLPRLQSLQLSGTRSFNWSLIPDAFSDRSIGHTHSRPLSSFILILALRYEV